MTKAKQVSKTLKNVLENPIMVDIQDRQANIQPAVEIVQNWWGFNLETRRPNVDMYGVTDLDLACFLYTLAERNAVINIPKYKSMGAATVREGEMLVSKDNRHGKLMGLVANKELFTFSVRILDQNVITEGGSEVGAFRNFALTNPEGKFDGRWERIDFLPDASENKFIQEHGLADAKGSIAVKHFIHPNRWTSLYGQYYFITKAMIQRLSEESQHLFSEIKRLLDLGVTYPETDKKDEWPKSEKLKGKKIIVEAFNAEVDFPDNGSKYPSVTESQETLVDITERRTKLVYTTIPALRFMTRATEYSWLQHVKENGLDSFPAWLGGGVKWDREFVFKGKRTKWDRLVIAQPVKFEYGLAIRTRTYEKSVDVAEDYQS